MNITDIVKSLGFIALGRFNSGITNTLLLAMPYKMYTSNSCILPAYYVCSNKGYHNQKLLIEHLNSNGVQAVASQELLVPFASKNAVGMRLKNQLLEVGRLGTLCALFAIETEAECDVVETANVRNICKNCNLCVKACPNGALSCDGKFKKSLCFRRRLKDMPNEMKQNQKQIVGCDICQRVCPMNAGIDLVQPPDEVVSAFSLEELLAGRTQGAIKLIGNNIDSNSLIAQAATIAANTGRHDLLSLIDQIASTSKSPNVQDHCAYAIKRLRN